MTRRIVSRDWLTGAADSDADTPAVLSAELLHVGSGVAVSYRNGRVIVAEHVSVDSLPNATELLVEEAS